MAALDFLVADYVQAVKPLQIVELPKELLNNIFPTVNSLTGATVLQNTFRGILASGSLSSRQQPRNLRFLNNA